MVSGSLTTNPVPVPSALFLLAPGLAGLALVRRKFKKQARYCGEPIEHFCTHKTGRRRNYYEAE